MNTIAKFCKEVGLNNYYISSAKSEIVKQIIENDKIIDTEDDVYNLIQGIKLFLKDKNTKYLELSAYKGNIDGLRLLGLAYLYKSSVYNDHNYKIALNIINYAIKQGDIKSYSSLGRCYKFYNKHDKALEYFIQGAIMGDVDSMHNAGCVLFETGEIANAIIYFNMAMKNRYYVNDRELYNKTYIIINSYIIGALFCKNNMNNIFELLIYGIL